MRNQIQQEIHYRRNKPKKSDRDLKKQFANIYKICNLDIIKFILILQKDVYPYEYMNDRKKFNETSLPEKRALQQTRHRRYYIEDADYKHAIDERL